MSSNKYILAIDQGTSGTKALIFDPSGIAVARGFATLSSHYFGEGFVEQDPMEIYQNVLQSVSACLSEFLAKGLKVADIGGIGISNQRETFVLWDEKGEPIVPAVVWQCKRSVAVCERLQKEGLGKKIQEKTGLIIDPYFSATKLIWLMENNDRVASAVRSGSVYFGTIDSWLLFKLTKGDAYATDHTNASRTLFFNLNTLDWDNELIEDFGLKGIRLPKVYPSSHVYGSTDFEGLVKSPIPITAMIGDSHAAAFGEGCFESGSAKVTLGTGSSILMNIGEKPIASRKGMVTTICWSTEHKVAFAFEGVIVSCGATVEWLKNELNLFESSRDTEAMAISVPDNGGVYLIPSFSGLGSPHWQMARRAEILGLNFSSTKNHIVRAALESIPYQIKDVIRAMEEDAGIHLSRLQANGGISANKFVMQFLADVLNKPTTAKNMLDVSALGAAMAAGLKAGVYENVATIGKMVKLEDRSYSPIHADEAEKFYQQWLGYIKKY